MFIVGFIVIVTLKRNNFEQQRSFIVGRQNRAPFINMMNICLGGGIVTIPTRNFARTMFIVWMFGCVIIRNAYLGSLFMMMQKRRNKYPFATMDELIDANYTLYVPDTLMYLFDGFPRAKQVYVYGNWVMFIQQ